MRSLSGSCVLLSVVAAAALAAGCSGRARSADPPASGESTAPHLGGSGERLILSWVDRDPARGPTLRFSARERDAWRPVRTVVGDPRLVADGIDVPSVVPLADGGLAAHWTIKRPGSEHA